MSKSHSTWLVTTYNFIVERAGPFEDGQLERYKRVIPLRAYDKSQSKMLLDMDFSNENNIDKITPYKEFNRELIKYREDKIEKNVPNQYNVCIQTTK